MIKDDDPGRSSAEIIPPGQAIPFYLGRQDGTVSMLTFRDLASWAGTQRVIHVERTAIAAWQIPREPEADTHQHRHPHRRSAHRARRPPDRVPSHANDDFRTALQAHHDGIKAGLTWSFGTQLHTGIVCYVLPKSDAWFANFTIDLWLRTLHHYGVGLLWLRQTATRLISVYAAVVPGVR
ncbi:hypothetical protein [Nonomuraea endophytica]|uniref:hypothetical protein n=1 Tax=Nonomuraea endophytica TaxID=714136 RepID=UPI0037C74EA7